MRVCAYGWWWGWGWGLGGRASKPSRASTDLLASLARQLRHAPPQLPLLRRSWLNPLLRCAQCLPPSARAVGVGTAMIMERAPQPGLLGAIMDLLRVATGVRAPGAQAAPLLASMHRTTVAFATALLAWR